MAFQQSRLKRAVMKRPEIMVCISLSVQKGAEKELMLNQMICSEEKTCKRLKAISRLVLIVDDRYRAFQSLPRFIASNGLRSAVGGG